MSAITATANLKSFARRVWLGVDRPEVSVLLASDNLRVRTPAPGAVWPVGSRQVVSWRIAGPTGDSVDIELVSADGVSRARTAAVLAGGVGPYAGGWAIAVPDVEPGRYRVLVTSGAGALDAYSGVLTVTA